jgi:hypothetical protein
MRQLDSVGLVSTVPPEPGTEGDEAEADDKDDGVDRSVSEELTEVVVGKRSTEGRFVTSAPVQQEPGCLEGEDELRRRDVGDEGGSPASQEEAEGEWGDDQEDKVHVAKVRKVTLGPHRCWRRIRRRVCTYALARRRHAPMSTKMEK